MFTKLIMLTVLEDNEFEVENTLEAVTLQGRFEKHYPTLRYLHSNNIAEDLNTYLNENNLLSIRVFLCVLSFIPIVPITILFYHR